MSSQSTKMRLTPSTPVENNTPVVAELSAAGPPENVRANLSTVTGSIITDGETMNTMDKWTMELAKTVDWFLDCECCHVPFRPQKTSDGHEDCQVVIIRPPKSVCVKGHFICEICKGDLTKCPTCQDEFANISALSLIEEILKIWGSKVSDKFLYCQDKFTNCRYRPCPEIVSKGGDHELFCGFKPTECMRCEWKGHAKEIFDHLKNNHAGFLNTGCDLPSQLYVRPKTYIPFDAFGHLLWYIITHDPTADFVSSWFFLIPNGKPNHDIFIKLIFKSNSGRKYATTIKYMLDSPHNSIHIPSSTLINFIGNDQLVAFELDISKPISVQKC